MATVEQLQELQEKRETLRKFRKLVQSEGWAELRRISEAQIETRRRFWHATPLTSEVVYKQQFELGEAGGMTALMALPDNIIDDYAAQVQELENQIGDSDESATDELTERSSVP